MSTTLTVARKRIAGVSRQISIHSVRICAASATAAASIICAGLGQDLLMYAFGSLALGFTYLISEGGDR